MSALWKTELSWSVLAVMGDIIPRPSSYSETGRWGELWYCWSWHWRPPYWGVEGNPGGEDTVGDIIADRWGVVDIVAPVLGKVDIVASVWGKVDNVDLAEAALELGEGDGLPAGGDGDGLAGRRRHCRWSRWGDWAGLQLRLGFITSHTVRIEVGGQVGDDIFFLSLVYLVKLSNTESLKSNILHFKNQQSTKLNIALHSKYLVKCLNWSFTNVCLVLFTVVESFSSAFSSYWFVTTTSSSLMSTLEHIGNDNLSQHPYSKLNLFSAGLI